MKIYTYEQLYKKSKQFLWDFGIKENLINEYEQKLGYQYWDKSNILELISVKYKKETKQKKTFTVTDPTNIITNGIGASISFNTNDYEQFKNMLPYQSNELIHIITSAAQNIECEGLTACNSYCITVETGNSIYKLQNVSKFDYFNILNQIET